MKNGMMKRKNVHTSVRNMIRAKNVMFGILEW